MENPSVGDIVLHTNKQQEILQDVENYWDGPLVVRQGQGKCIKDF